MRQEGTQGHMSQIEDLQARITRALDRIGQGVDKRDSGLSPEEVERLRNRALQAEKSLAEVQEALEATREQAAAELASARAEAEEARDRAVAEALAQATPDPAPDPAEETSEAAAPDVAELRDALEDEKLANAQLEERLRVLRARLAEAEAAPPTDAAPDGLAELDVELQRLREANDELAKSNAALREANAEGVGEPQLINEGLIAELQGLRAARAAEAAEAAAVYGALGPLLAEAAEEGNR